MFYLQIQGTAMGTIFAPSYATLSIGFHEPELYAIIRNKFTLPVYNLFWTKLKKNFKGLLHIFKIKFNKAKRIARCFKQVKPAIQFTMESDTQLPFIDVMIIKEGKKVFMDIYSKPTDSKRYVSFKWNHPKHCMKNIPFSLARRICMIAEKDSLKKIRWKN